MAWARRKKEILEFENINEDCFIFRTNFAGLPEANYGKRGFNLKLKDGEMELLPPEKIEQLMEDGWNIKSYLDDDDNRILFLPVEVRFDKYPPNIFIIGGSSRVMTELDEARCGEIDTIIKNNLESMDLAITPSFYQKDNGDWKIKAYLQAAWVTFREGKLGAKWASYETSEEPEDPDVPF